MLTAKNSNEKIVLNFIDAYSQQDSDKIKPFLADNIVAYIANKPGQLDKVVGQQQFIDRHQQMKTSGVKLQLTVPQIITINAGKVMVMMNVEAEREVEKMHNHAAYLLIAIDSKLSELWMVDALPQYSDHFWKD